MDPAGDSNEDLRSWSHVEHQTAIGVHEYFGPGTDYEPSLLTDFSAMLPTVSDVSLDILAEDYNSGMIVQSAWQTLPTRELEMPWEGDFWSKFLDPNVSAMDLFTRGLKRPMPFHTEQSQTSSASAAVESRVVANQVVEVKSFLQHIRDVPIRTWREEREATWEVAVRRWVALLDQWNSTDTPLLIALQKQVTFVAKAQILVDVFYNKAPQTLMKRVNSLSKMCGTLHEQGIVLPCTEEQFYRFLKSEVNMKAPASRLKAYFESIVFSRHVVGVESLQGIVNSRRCLGASLKTALTCPRQATPFTVEQLCKLHEILRAGEELWDRAMCGMILFCTYGRSRWSDSQHAEGLLQDRDAEGTLHFLEIKSAVHKTARALHLRHMFLPVAAPAVGVTSDCWGEQWLQVRRMLGIESLSKYPLMPAPDSSLEPTERPVSTSETKRWMQYLLGDGLVKSGMRLTSHSCKCTCLSFMAKRGASYEDRLVLGYHTNKLRVAMTYSRDSAARPLALLQQVLQEIREGVFEPDCTRSGRLKSGAKPLSGEVQSSVVSADIDIEKGLDLAMDSLATNLEAEPVCPDAGEQVECVADVQDLEGHATTDSSDSSGADLPAWAPVVGHYVLTIPENKRLWMNCNTKMFHLSHLDHVKVLLCGRRITASFKKHEDQIRFDSAKCRQCFRLINSEH
jgi:hypothetical protein